MPLTSKTCPRCRYVDLGGAGGAVHGWFLDEQTLTACPPTHHPINLHLQRPFEDSYREFVFDNLSAQQHGILVPFLNDIRDSFSVRVCGVCVVWHGVA